MDSTKAAVPGVSVKVINTATTATANVVPSESGSYIAANLSPGPYRVEASLQGFQTSIVEGITLNAGTTTRVDVTLSLGAVTESVNVTAEQSALQTEDAKIATVVPNRLIDELPLVVGGAQGGAFRATLDGISVNTNRQADTGETAFLTPSLEAIIEFQVETNGFRERFSKVAQQYLALGAKSMVAPNRAGIVPGTFGYVNNNYVSEGKSTVEKTNKFSIKIDQVLSNVHRVSYIFNRTRNSRVPGPNGTTGLPEPFSNFQQSSFDGDLHRASWDWVGARTVNHLTVGANTFLKNSFSPNVDKNWKDRVCHSGLARTRLLRWRRGLRLR